MKEALLRKWHRRLGIMFVTFIIFQAGSGLMISYEKTTPSHSLAHGTAVLSPPGHKAIESVWHKTLEFVHYGASPLGDVYRIIWGIGTLGVAISGVLIALHVRTRLQRDRIPPHNV